MSGKEELSSNSGASTGGTVTLRVLLTRALRAQGFGEVCKDEPKTSGRLANVLSQNLLLSILSGLVLFSSVRLGWDFWTTAAAIFASLVLLVLAVMAKGCTNLLGYLAYMATWIAIGLYLLIDRDYDTLFITHFLPFLVIAGIRWAARAIRFTVHVPFFIPITLLLVLLPLISEDPWRMAVASGWRIVLLAALTLIPLSIYLLVRLRRLDVATVLLNVVETLNARDLPVHDAWKRLAKNLNKPAENIDSDAAIARLADAFDADSDVTTDRLTRAVAVMAKRFRRIASARVISILAGVWIAVTALLYLLALVIMPQSLATDWSKSGIGRINGDFFVWEISFVTGPYLHVAFLLGTIAAVGFAGFVLTEEKYFEGFTKGAIGQPAEQYLILVLPYLALVDEESKNANESEEGPPSANGALG
ncbi:hypothetical protein AB0M54_26915 [Actinoplanes sp. NPDC051470]|uniref:hypothetical protein n=1 Tax=Actinoplanes sp. NPDC051470 TaxID=3157224 RepID=UPI0034157ADC